MTDDWIFRSSKRGKKMRIRKSHKGKKRYEYDLDNRTKSETKARSGDYSGGIF